MTACGSSSRRLTYAPGLCRLVASGLGQALTTQHTPRSCPAAKPHKPCTHAVASAPMAARQPGTSASLPRHDWARPREPRRQAMARTRRLAPLRVAGGVAGCVRAPGCRRLGGAVMEVIGASDRVRKAAAVWKVLCRPASPVVAPAHMACVNWACGCRCGRCAGFTAAQLLPCKRLAAHPR